MTCLVSRACKNTGDIVPWGFDFTGYLTNEWSEGTVFLVGDVIRPADSTGYEYISSGGQSGSSEPRWPRTLASTVTDGSITWTAQAISNDSLRTTIDTSVWFAPTDISISVEQVYDTDGMQMTSALIGGGVAGESYDVLNTVTFDDGSVEVSIIRVSVE